MYKKSLSALLCGAFALSLAATSQVAAQQTKSAAEQAEEQLKVEVASGLMTLGEASKDGDMLATAAKILSTIKAGVVDPKMSSDANPMFYDVGEVVEKAKALGAAPSLLDQIKTNERAGERWACYYEWYCNGYYCEWWYVC